MSALTTPHSCRACLQEALDNGDVPDDWPDDVCRDAFCGWWERNNGYVWHRESDHPVRSAESRKGSA